MNYRASLSKSSVLVTFACAFALILSACGSSQHRGAPDGDASATLTITDNGTREFRDVQGPLDQFRYYRVVPSSWPSEDGAAPILAFGEVVVEDGQPRPIQWATRQLNPATELVAIGSTDIPAMTGSKQLGSVLTITDSQVRIDKGVRDGVSPGDVYFVLNRTHEDRGDLPRFGQRIGALIAIREIGESYAIGDVVHADVPLEVGDPIVFAQVQSDDSIPSATLVFSPIEGAEAHPGSELPAIASALPDYLSEYLISNVAIETLPESIDPRPWTAPETAIELAPSDAFGTLIFGAIDPDTDEFIYNATLFGNAPHPANSVGILPGGLRIPLDDGIESLSRQLVPSFVATALAQRNEHANAIYLLESALRSQSFNQQVRYHLREHLALRYHSIGLTDDAIQLITHDILEARESGNRLAELNALSIRSFLYSQLPSTERWVADSRAFLALADGIIPEAALYYERLSVARALRASGDFEEASEITLDVLAHAQTTNNTDLQYSALFQLALTQLDLGQPDAALLVLADLEDMIPVLSEQEQAELMSVAGVLYAEAGNPRDAAERIIHSLRIVTELNDPALRARVSIRAASALISAGRSLESIQYLQSAVVGFTESYQFGDAAETLAQLAYRELTVANESAGQGSSGPQLVALAREHLANASESLVVLGRDLDAASQFFALGVLEFRIGNLDGARIFLDRAREFSLRSGDYEALAAIAQQRAELAEESGDTIAQEQFVAESLKWMRAAGIDSTPAETPSAPSPEQTAPDDSDSI